MAGRLGVVVMGLVSRLSLDSHLAWPTTQGPSLWREQLSAKMDSSMKDSGRLVRHIMGWCLLSPSGPSGILPVSFLRQHQAPYQEGPPGVRQLLQVVIIVPGPGRRFLSEVPEQLDSRT